MQENIVSAAELRKQNSPVLGLAKEFSKKSFWHYTKCTSANYILATPSRFRIGPMSKTNDEREKSLHKSVANKLYALCFCNSDTEKIPLWYLYSGICGNGCSLGFTPGNMIN